MGPYTSAVDVPPLRVELELGQRRHRRLTAPAGLLLFICLFLPALRECNEIVYPTSMPMFWHPYIYGLVLAAGAAKVTVRHLRRTVLALRILAWLSIVGSAFLIGIAGALALAELLVGVLMLAAIGRRGCSERRVALSAIAISALSVVWFGFALASSDAMAGLYLSVAASSGLLAGGLVWFAETGPLPALRSTGDLRAPLRG